MVVGDTRFTVYEAANGKVVQTFAGHTASILAVAFSPDGRHVLSGGEDKTARLWEIETGREVRLYQGPSQMIAGVAFTPDGTKVITTGGLATVAPKTKKVILRTTVVYAFDTETGKLLRHWDGFPDIVRGLRVTGEGNEIIAIVGNTLRTMSLK